MTGDIGGSGPANIMKHLGGLQFPASKQQIIDHAKNTQSPDTDQVITVLRQIDDREYDSPAGIMNQIGKIE